MTHEEEEEMKHDMSKLRYQVQQISLSQKVTKSKINGFIYRMEAKIDGIEEKFKGNMEDLKKYREGLFEGWTKLLQERLPNDEKLVEETHDENKRNVNHDFIEYNVGLKTHHIPMDFLS